VCILQRVAPPPVILNYPGKEVNVYGDVEEANNNNNNNDDNDNTDNDNTDNDNNATMPSKVKPTAARKPTAKKPMGKNKENIIPPLTPSRSRSPTSPLT
jgi:hypothetical protein